MNNVDEIRAELGKTAEKVYYNGEKAVTMWAEGDLWAVRVGHQTFSDENASAQTIEWAGDAPIFYGSRAEAEKVFERNTL